MRGGAIAARFEEEQRLTRELRDTRRGDDLRSNGEDIQGGAAIDSKIDRDEEGRSMRRGAMARKFKEQ